MKKKIEHALSSGNVFSDLGFSNPEEMLAKAELASQINDLIKQKKLTKKKASKLLFVDQDKIADLNSRKLFDFSLESLFRFLNILGQQIMIQVSPKVKSKKNLEISVNYSKIIKKTPTKQKGSFEGVRLHARKKAKK